jgi:hypothetical protein
MLPGSVSKVWTDLALRHWQCAHGLRECTHEPLVMTVITAMMSAHISPLSLCNYLLAPFKVCGLSTCSLRLSA